MKPFVNEVVTACMQSKVKMFNLFMNLCNSKNILYIGIVCHFSGSVLVQYQWIHGDIGQNTVIESNHRMK